MGSFPNNKLMFYVQGYKTWRRWKESIIETVKPIESVLQIWLSFCEICISTQHWQGTPSVMSFGNKMRIIAEKNVVCLLITVI